MNPSIVPFSDEVATLMILFCIGKEKELTREILERKRRELEQELSRIRESIAYIDRKQNFYDDVLSGKAPYVSNLNPDK